MKNNCISSENPFFVVKDVAVHRDISLKERVKILLLRKGMTKLR